VLERLEAVSHPDQLLRLRLVGQLHRRFLPELDFTALQVRGSERNFHCQVETDRVVWFDATGGLRVGYGVSFDAREELQATLQAMVAESEDPWEQEVVRAAGERLLHRYDELTGAAR